MRVVCFLLSFQLLVAVAFVCPSPKAFVSRSSAVLLSPQEHVNTETGPASLMSWMTKAVVAAVPATLLSPALALAETTAVADDYEYGAVNAPLGLAWGVGVLAILTALLPIFLRSGEDAFNEMRERDQDTFGSAKSTLDRKRK